MAPRPYRQVLPAIGLSLERYTDSVPADGGWYLLREGKQLGRFRSKALAEQAWKAAVADSGWQPVARTVDPGETMRRENVERWARNRGG